MTSIKTRREVTGLLTPEQRAKEKSEHAKVMHQQKGTGRITAGPRPMAPTPMVAIRKAETRMARIPMNLPPLLLRITCLFNSERTQDHATQNETSES